MKRVEKHEQRLRYLKALYDLAQGSPLQTVNHKEIDVTGSLISVPMTPSWPKSGLLQTQKTVGR